MQDEVREHWIVDEEAADVVRRIFAMTMDGYGPYQIANRLSQEKIEIPSLHLSHYGEGVNQSKTFKDPYGWGSSTIVNILKKREYLGHTINFKTRKHFKDKKSHYVDENEWVIFENTHAAIIDPETFENVQRIRSNVKRYPDGWGEAAPLMVQSVREMYNYDRRTRYHKAFYSLDAFDWTEKYALEHSPSAEEIILLKEEQAAHEKLLAMLDEALSIITPMQARRVKGYYIRGLDFTRIAKEEGVDKSVVNRSVHRGLKCMREFYSHQQTE